MLIGYARVPTGDRSLKLQMNALEEAGCERVFQDWVSGISILDRISIMHSISLDREGCNSSEKGNYRKSTPPYTGLENCYISFEKAFFPLYLQRTSWLGGRLNYTQSGKTK